MNPFNLQAVLMYSAPQYPTVTDVHGQRIEIFAVLQPTGGYYLSSKSLHLPGVSNELKKRLVAHGINPMEAFRQVCQAEACKALFAFGAQVDPCLLQEPPEYAAFLQAQIEALAEPNIPRKPMYARAEFIQLATPLLQEVKSQLLREYSIRELVNPVQSLALSKRREGVFVWPDWSDFRYVNIISNTPATQRNRMRDIIFDWAEGLHLRPNLDAHF